MCNKEKNCEFCGYRVCTKCTKTKIPFPKNELNKGRCCLVCEAKLIISQWFKEFKHDENKIDTQYVSCQENLECLLKDFENNNKESERVVANYEIEKESCNKIINEHEAEIIVENVTQTGVRDQINQNKILIENKVKENTEIEETNTATRDKIRELDEEIRRIDDEIDDLDRQIVNSNFILKAKEEEEQMKKQSKISILSVKTDSMYRSKMSKRIKESMISNATVKSTKSKHKTKIKNPNKDITKPSTGFCCVVNDKEKATCTIM